MAPNAARPNQRRLGRQVRDVVHDLPALLTAPLQGLEIGQWVPMSPSAPSDRTAFKVAAFAVNESLLCVKSDSTWARRLTRTGRGTRLVTRMPAAFDWQHPLSAFLGMVLMEFGDFAMLRRMLRGIKVRAESLSVDQLR